MTENLYPVHETFREYQIEKALLLAHNSPLRLEAEDPLDRFSSSLSMSRHVTLTISKSRDILLILTIFWLRHSASARSTQSQLGQETGLKPPKSKPLAINYKNPSIIEYTTTQARHGVPCARLNLRRQGQLLRHDVFGRSRPRDSCPRQSPSERRLRFT